MKIYKQQFDDIFRQHHSELCKIAYRKVGDFHVAEDLVQELFMEFWNRKTKFSDIEKISNYLKRSISLKCNDHLKSILKKENQVIRLDGLDIKDVSIQDDSEEENYLFKKLIQHIELLPPKRKAVFILSRFDNRSYKEIATDLDISIKTVEKHISKALLQLRTLLGMISIVILNIFR